MTKLLVAVGFLYKEEHSVEIINLDENNPDLICDDLPEIPVGQSGQTGQRKTWPIAEHMQLQPF